MSKVLCAAGTRPGESCNEHLILLSLPACEPRARQRRTHSALPSDAPRRPFRKRAHHVRAASRPDRATVPITPSTAWRDRGSIARGARGQPRDKWFRSLAPPRGSVWKRAPVEWRPHRRANIVQGAVRGARGGAIAGGGSGTSDGSCCAPVPVSHRGSGHLTWLAVARRFESNSGGHLSVNVSVTCVGGVSKVPSYL